jgi:hypothetical protein
MNSVEKPLVYVILGAAGSGRREVLCDLIEGGLGEDARPAVMLAAAEPAAEIDAKLPAVSRWTWTLAGTIEADLPAGATHVFFMTDGHRASLHGDQLPVGGEASGVARVVRGVRAFFRRGVAQSARGRGQ